MDNIWSRIGNSLRWRSLRATQILPIRTIRSVYGPRLSVRRSDATFTMYAMGLYGTFIPDVIKSIQGVFQFLDIGANAGIFSLVADATPACTFVLSIEPIPANFAKLVENIELNKALKITPICGAISDSPNGVVHLSYDPNHTGLSTISGNGVPAIAISPACLTSLVPKNPDRIVAKIDVEGSEIEVLSVLSACSWFERITDIIIEVSDLRIKGHSGPLIDAVLSRGFNEVARNSISINHHDVHFRR